MHRQFNPHRQSLRVGVKRSRDDMEVDEKSLEELFAGMTTNDEMRDVFINLFSDLIDGELPVSVRKAAEVERILETILKIDEILQRALMDYDFCKEFSKDFTGKDCENERLVMEEARARNKATRRILQKELNQAI